ncbi:GNAT family N-acetyltransferase [Dactylosporangium sp. CA-139066]|uniref:GNAT family N-acetyltransferase n=1 Tax=Dactylosporangium sp. CA-139066 TaxID=3239930 RepID=UPI003D8C9796
MLAFYDDPGEFLAVAGAHLAADPVVSTVVTTNAHRLQSRPPDAQSWWVVATDPGGAVLGAGMRTAPFAPRPPFLLPMPADAAVALARALHERGEPIAAVNGARPAVEPFAAETARLTGGEVEVSRHTRLHELGDLVAPAPAPGGLRPATPDDLDLVAAWYAAFMGDADEQAGRPRDASADEAPDTAEIRRRIEDGWVWLWTDGDGRPVHMTAANPPSFGVARIGPVYTPPAERGRGWASNAVAEVSRRIRAEGARACLFTDQANPTSNKVYAALGYRPVVDMVNLVIRGSRGVSR